MTITLAKFQVWKNECEWFVKKHNIWKWNNRYWTVSDELKKLYQEDKLPNIYMLVINEWHYDVILKDESIIQFDCYYNWTENCLRYSYYQFPLDKDSFNQYLEDMNVWYSDWLYEYELFLEFMDTNRINHNAVSIRYDHDSIWYKKHIHSKSHFHIWAKNNIRIPVSWIIKPAHFIIFIIKQIYPAMFFEMLKDSDFLDYYNKHKKQIKYFDRTEFDLEDRFELYLS